MIRRPAHLNNATRFDKQNTKRATTLITAIKGEVDQVFIEKTKQGVIVDDLCVEILPTPPDDIEKCWTNAFFNIPAGKWIVLAWQEGNCWFFILPLNRFDSTAAGSASRWVMMPLVSFGVWLRGQYGV